MDNNDIYVRMNDMLLMASAQRRAEASYGKLAQLKADILAAEQAQQWIIHLCWWLHHCGVGWWNEAHNSALGMERIRTA